MPNPTPSTEPGSAPAASAAIDASPIRELFLANILKERAAQDAQWGGPEHDDQHAPYIWEGMIIQMASRLTPTCAEPKPNYRARLVKIAALALAAFESDWRRTATARAEAAR